MKFCDERIQKHLLNGGKVKRRDIDVVVSINKEKRLSCDCSKFYILTQYDLIYDDWEIVEPEYDWDKIIEDKILCQFWDELEETNTPCVGYLTKKTVDGFYKSEWYCSWKHCKPFNPKDFNIVNNIKEYEK